MLRILFSVFVCLLLCKVGSAQCYQAVPTFDPCASSFSAQDEFPIDIPCAVKAGQAFVSCRQEGGRIFACALTGFGVYLDCNGGLARSRRAARRASRAARVRSRARIRSALCY